MCHGISSEISVIALWYVPVCKNEIGAFTLFQKPWNCQQVENSAGDIHVPAGFAVATCRWNGVLPDEQCPASLSCRVKKGDGNWYKYWESQRWKNKILKIIPLPDFFPLETSRSVYGTKGLRGLSSAALASKMRVWAAVSGLKSLKIFRRLWFGTECFFWSESIQVEKIT